MKKNRFLLILIAVFLINSCLNSVSLEADEALIQDRYPNYSYEYTGKDKWENFNRKIFMSNILANKYMLRPINIIWATIMPQYGMDRINNLYANMNYPVRLFGSLLQGDGESAKTETKRFFINTTIGLAGLYDVALNKFHIEPRKEDIEQALAYRNVKQGPYLVLPVVTEGSTRDIAGWALDLPLNLCNYLFVIGPVSAISGGVSYLNDSTLMQPIYKMAEDYADPYSAVKQFDSIDKYIKNKNIDRTNYLKEAKISDYYVNNEDRDNSDLKADINLENYNAQNSETDAMRSMLFDTLKPEKSTWSELSLWNKTFNKKLKTASIKFASQKPSFKYRYILQADKNAPVAIVYPSIGEGFMSKQSVALADILYNNGYSVIILPSSFNWAFAKSMPGDFKPGLPANDAHCLRIVTSQVINRLQQKYNINFSKKIIVGTSFGALAGLFVAREEENDHRLGISNYIFICPPVQMFYALGQIDKFSQNWLKDKANIKYDAAVMSEKIIQVTNNHYDTLNGPVDLPFTQDEAKLAISFSMRQKLYDLVFTLEHGSVTKKNEIYDMVNQMSFYDYAQKYIMPNQNKSVEELDYDSSLYSLKDFLSENKNYTIYHSLDDCFTSAQQLKWLKSKTGNRMVLFSNGSHLGFLYRKEFLDEFTNDIYALRNGAKL